MKRCLLIFLIVILAIASFAACTGNAEGKLKINVPDEILQEELGSYDLPEFQVVDETNLIKAGYEVIVKKAVDPNGNELRIAYNQINATIPGIYTVIYGVVGGKVPDAELKIDFADCTAPILDMKADAIPEYYIKDAKYSLPAYKLTGNTDYSTSWAKVYYLTDKNAEPQEVAVVDGFFTVEYNTGIYRIVIHAEDTAHNVKEYVFNIEATGPSEIIDGKIVYFDEKFGSSQVQALWKTFDFSYSSEVFYGDEKGSMKVVTTSEADYIILDKVLESDVSQYDYLIFRIYNDNDYDVFSGLAWYGDTVLKAKEWTEIIVPVSWFETQEIKTVNTDKRIYANNIKGLAIRLFGDYETNTCKAGSTFYFSAMYAFNASAGEEIPENVIAKFDDFFDVTSVGLLWAAPNKLSIDNEVVFREEKGSLKVSYTQEQEFNYLVFNAPHLKDISAYDYIAFNVYNPTNNKFLVQYCWGGAVEIQPNGWTAVKWPVSAFADGSVEDATDEDITGMKIYFSGEGMAVGDCFYISTVYAGNEEYKELAHLPQYDGNYNIINCDDGTYMMHISNADATSFENYCNDVLTKGFEKKSQRSAANNMFATFSDESKYIYVYFTAYNSEMRVVTGPVESLLLEDYSVNSGVETTPYIASVPQPAQGEGYIVRLPDGRFIIQDGGYEGDDRVYNTLRELVGDEKIVIAAWFISHPHADHYPAFIDFIKNHANDSDVTIERVVQNYGHYEMFNVNGNTGDGTGESVLKIYDSLEEYAPNVPVFRAHTGQVIDFGCAKVEILYTIEDFIPNTLENPNDSSMVIRLEVEGDSIVFLNDTCYTSGPILHELWGSYLKSDIVQIAHHGMWPSVESIYHDIAAEVVLFPNLHKYLKNYLVDSRWVDVINAALSYAKDISVSGDKLVVLELPYVFENNKDEKVEYILNYTGRDEYTGFDAYDMQDGDIAPFDKFVGGYTSLSASHGIAEYTTEQKFGDEAGSLKLTVAKESEVYLTISLPYTTDISAYDYIVFKVYNPTDSDIMVGICWAGDTTCKAGEWTEVKIPVSNFDSGKIDALTGKDIPITNICGLVVRFISGFEANDVFYISAVRAEKETVEAPEVVAENVAVKFDKDSDLSHIGVYWPTAHNIAIDTATKHGDDAGSLKVTLVTNSDNYIILSAPYNTDFSEYDYISFWVYNAGSADFEMGTTWAADTTCIAGQWTEVKITKEMFEASKVKDMSSAVLAMADVTNLPLRIFGTSDLTAGESFYISAVTAGKN